MADVKSLTQQVLAAHYTAIENYLRSLVDGGVAVNRIGLEKHRDEPNTTHVTIDGVRKGKFEITLKL